MPAKISYSADGGGQIEQIYSDWREAGGLRLPHQWTIMQGGNKAATVSVDAYKINSGLTPEVLNKKP